MDKSELLTALKDACAWITDVAQVKSPEQARVGRGKLMRYARWEGAIRGEYSAAARAWDFFCPVWHTGQAVKALVMASRHLGDFLLESAVRGADFILGAQVADGKDKGLILAFEDKPDKVNTSAILECLDGLFCLSEKTGESKFRDAALDALAWVVERAYVKGEGLFLDLYDPASGAFIPNAYGCPARPLLDDGVFLSGFRLSGDRRFRDIALETARRLLRDESPPGNWINYPPCSRKMGVIHPRHAYWWGYPMKAVFAETREQPFMDCFRRSVQWYRSALRRDGGLFRGTAVDFKTDSFGHATSGVGCAAIMLAALYEMENDRELLKDMESALAFCCRVQFTRPADPNLKGAILEKILPPDGTDNPPYYLRDLGTIFFVQAASYALSLGIIPACGAGHLERRKQ